jgi:acetyl esterase
MSKLTPKMAALLERIARAGRPALHNLSVDQARALYNSAAEVLDLPRTAQVQSVDVTIPAPQGVLMPARLYRPALAPSSDQFAPAAMLYLHGGGFTVGGLETHDSLCRQMSLRCGVAVLALDYRLAPEHRFPAAVEDAWHALVWLCEHGHGLGLDSTRLAVGGDSAGGTLAAVCALMAAQHESTQWLGRFQPTPAQHRTVKASLRCQVLITPGTTAWADTASHREFGQGFLLDAEGIEWFFNQYMGPDRDDRQDWRFAPLLAESFEDVVPACIALAECDPLVDEGLAYADKLRMAGIPVSLELFRGVTHDFIKMGRVLPQAVEALDALALHVRGCLLSDK